jgi:hypothetical protein
MAQSSQRFEPPQNTGRFSLNEEQLRELASDLIAKISDLGQSITSKHREILYRGSKIDQLTHEIAFGGEKEVNRVTCLVHSPIQVFPLTIDFDTG